MPAESLRRLIERHHPGTAVSRLEEEAGTSGQVVGYWLKPGTQVTRLPSVRQLQEIARVIRRPIQEVYHAFRADCGLDLADDLPEDERELLRNYRRLSDTSQRKLIAIAAILHAE